jgi:hypothetical protein
MNVNLDLGPKNIPIILYQHCWEVVNHDIAMIFGVFHAGTFEANRLNYGIIHLLPKASGVDKITRYFGNQVRTSCSQSFQC